MEMRGGERRGELPLISQKNKCHIILRYVHFISRSIHKPDYSINGEELRAPSSL
jgi:hypothetical protein